MKRFLSLFRSKGARSNGPNNHDTKPVLSCVVDHAPKFLMQSWVWLISAKEAGAFEDCHVILHHVGPAPRVLRKAAKRFGAKIIEIEAFGEGAARYCNKLQSHAPILKTAMNGVILTDVDLFFFTSPANCWSPDYVRAKIVDHPNPPETLLSNLAEVLNLPDLTYEARPSFASETRTHPLNSNGGLYAFPMRALETISPLWHDYSTTCLSREDILGKWLHHADQIGFMMSMIKTDQAFQPLELSWNFPTHFRAEAYEGKIVTGINILHYHNELSPEGRLMPTGVANIDRQIERANEILRPYEKLPEYKIIQAEYAASLS